MARYVDIWRPYGKRVEAAQARYYADAKVHVGLTQALYGVGASRAACGRISVLRHGPSCVAERLERRLERRKHKGVDPSSSALPPKLATQGQGWRDWMLNKILRRDRRAV